MYKCSLHNFGIKLYYSHFYNVMGIFNGVSLNTGIMEKWENGIVE
jgi:hypothetical protein